MLIYELFFFWFFFLFFFFISWSGVVVESALNFITLSSAGRRKSVAIGVRQMKSLRPPPAIYFRCRFSFSFFFPFRLALVGVAIYFYFLFFLFSPHRRPLHFSLIRRRWNLLLFFLFFFAFPKFSFFFCNGVFDTSVNGARLIFIQLWFFF